MEYRVGLPRRRMKSKKRILFVVPLVVLLAGLTWLLMPAPDPLFHGKPESEWIKGIANGLSLSESESQEQRWRDFGPDGVRVLARAVDRADRPVQRTYRRVYRRLSAMLPGFLVRLLPSPGLVLTAGPPSNVIDLLSRLGLDAKPAAPAVARALKSDDDGVRQIAISFFTLPENGDALLNQLPGKQKKKLLADFIRAFEDRSANWGLRNNAVIALKYYPEQAQVVAPILVKALQDPIPQVRMCAAESLNRVAPDMVRKARVVPIVIGVLRDPDDQIAWRAALLLGEMQKEPTLAVPALIESLENTNWLVASTAAQALLRFEEQAGMIIPGLEKAAKRNDIAGGWAKSGLKQLESEAATNQGVQK